MEDNAKVGFDKKMPLVKMVLRSVALGLLIGGLPLPSRSLVFAFFDSSSDLLSDAWKLLNAGFTRHASFFFVNIVVLALLAPSGLLGEPHGYDTALKLQKSKLQAVQQWKTSGSLQRQNANWNGQQPEIEGGDLTPASVETELDACCLAKPKVADTVPSAKAKAKAVRSPIENHSDLVKEELDDLHERIEAFIAKARRQMMQQ